MIWLLYFRYKIGEILLFCVLLIAIIATTSPFT
jgi:hypothetical protein